VIIADVTDEKQGGKPGILIAIPFDEMRKAVEEGRALVYDVAGQPSVTVIFGASHDALIDTIKSHALEVRGEENLR
jgi:hypothetical protein